ncbi:TetR/AcrR family transcriptional regulator [Cellulomonas sp. Leaf395]|uniref:TetR/AcrR family transcriptional regulator n=1 Tax=Cellulomonas sp. Leaf395 TaxID=1736362 RepID=UPI0006FBC06A|nr:TetR/AcrR family transcriptional regulator [Cellulomonas sp. Leaf395]KQT02053.1 TetR family transcriptional regulator [Cellulomonas sp. Leaf395]
MLEDPPVAGRRAALRERHHRSIVDAAATLMRETGGTTFTVDELARRADVSRRTVFNHFDSLDDVVTTVCGEILGTVFDSLEAHTAASTGATMFDELAHALTATDLVTPMAYLTRVLRGGGDELTPRQAAMVGQALTDVSQRMSAELVRRHPDADRLDVDLLVGSLMSGVLVLHRHWCSATGGGDDTRSRDVWAYLVERLLTAVRTGHADAPASGRAAPDNHPRPAPAPILTSLPDRKDHHG